MNKYSKRMWILLLKGIASECNLDDLCHKNQKDEIVHL